MSINSFFTVLINNWFVLLLIFVVIAGIIYQRFRMTEICYIQEYQDDFPLLEGNQFVHQIWLGELLFKIIFMQ